MKSYKLKRKISKKKLRAGSRVQMSRTFTKVHNQDHNVIFNSLNPSNKKKTGTLYVKGVRHHARGSTWCWRFSISSALNSLTEHKNLFEPIFNLFRNFPHKIQDAYSILLFLNDNYPSSIGKFNTRFWNNIFGLDEHTVTPYTRSGGALWQIIKYIHSIDVWLEQIF